MAGLSIFTNEALNFHKTSIKNVFLKYVALVKILWAITKLVEGINIAGITVSLLLERIREVIAINIRSSVFRAVRTL